MNKLVAPAYDIPPCHQGQAGLRSVLRSLDRGGWEPFRMAGKSSQYVDGIYEIPSRNRMLILA